MAVKHVKQFYEQVSSQYQDMLGELRDFTQLAEDKLFPPERLEQIKQNIQPLKDNYERWSYMMYLLNLPNRKSKQPKYHRQNKRLIIPISKNNSLQSVIEESNKVLDSLKDLK